jgi:hypothetical protein
MKRLVMLLVVIALPLLAGSMTRTVSYGLNDVMLSKAGGYDVVDLPGALPLVKPGDPRLPDVIQTVAIPAGADPTSVDLIAEEWVDLPGNYRVGPSQADVRLPLAGETFKPVLAQPNAEVYASTEPYPSVKVRLLSNGTMSGYRLANVELFPVRYTPATGKLQLARRLVYRLNYTENRFDAAVANQRQRDLFGSAMRTLVVNPEDVNRFAPVIRRSTATTLPAGTYDYVTITESPMDTVFQRLAAWKTLKGVPDTVVRVSWINANYTGYDTCEKIRNFIKDAHATWGTNYILLGGRGDYNDAGQSIVPTRLANTGSEDNEPCDHYYECLDGTWDDGNHNHTYGEIADNPDLYADVYVGRAPVTTVAMAQNFVHKVITYEQNPPTNYVKHMNLLTGILWDSYEERPMQESIARMTQSVSGWSDQRLYERTGNLSTAAVTESLNQGDGMGHWDGHGNQEGIYMTGGTVPVFTLTNADALTNGDKTAIIVSIACDCGGWDMETGGSCFAEHLVNRVGGGTIASVMNSRYGYGAIDQQGNYTPGPSERQDTTMFHNIFFYGHFHTSQALALAKAAWAPWADSLYAFAETRYVSYDLNVLGDPETPLWTDEPAACNVSHLAVMNIGNNVPFTVTVTTPGAVPIESAAVVCRKGAEVFARGQTNGSGQVTLNVSPVTPGPMSVTVVAHNYFVHIDTCLVISTSRYVSYLSSVIDDASPGGNGDSILNPGETVTIPTWVRNWGTLTASGVTAKLRTHDANAQVTDSAKSFGDIPAGDSACTGSNGFGLHVNDGLSNGYAVSCSLICTDALDSTWVSLVSFTVNTPILTKGAVTVRDSARGNGNGRIDPGEQSDLQVELLNSGGGHGYNCYAVLSSGDARFHILSANSTYGLIRKGDSASNASDLFVVQADDSIPIETPVTCTLYAYADGGYASAPQVFTLVIGQLRTVDPIPDGPRTPSLYYAYDDVDAGYPAHPTYNWIEIDGVGTQLSYTQNDVVLAENLPSGFGPFKFYGQRFSQISISADGWICPGTYTTTNFTNEPIPGSGTPPGMICGNWDDLEPSPDGTGYIYMYGDTTNHRLVVEWDNVAYYGSSTTDKFEIVFYDTTVTTPSGDNEIVVQYMTANGYTSSTLGIEDPTQAIGIQALYNGTYNRGCAPIAAGRAIAYLALTPLGIMEQDNLSSVLAKTQFIAYPNPFKGLSNIAWSVKTAGDVNLKVYDASGRVVRNLVQSQMKPGRYSVTWNGKANDGRMVSAGIYFYKLETASGKLEQKVILTR